MAHNVELSMVQQAQLKRNEVVKLLHHPQLSELVAGCFVRVLLELENRGEDYRVGKVIGVEEAQPYSGFTNDPTTTTRLHLHLQLQGQLTGINGSHYQLNSISNSQITQSEFEAWARECPLDESEVQQAGTKVLRIREMPRAPPIPVSAPPRALGENGVAQLAATAIQSSPNGATGTPGSAPAEASSHHPPGLNGTTRVAQRIDVELELPTADQVRRQVLEECRMEHAVFPRTLTPLTAAQLRVVERELLDYLERVRKAISSNQPNCVVCMDRLPTIITLPCKHKVLCRLCASQVTSCPVCRTTAVEMFEPVEL